ncbi:MAG: glycosyltransferase family 2 protein [Rhodobacteraceae bacterium]|nr:glycosyltransferase family 2 protein [Paracoccaceae bacterium]
MTDQLPLSVFIITKNEEDRIARAIESVSGIAAEIIVVDSGSTDSTVKVAEEAGARVIFNEWPGYGPQKRFGEDQCKHDWLLNIDADEALTPELVQELRELFESGRNTSADSWRIMIRDVFPHEEWPTPWAYGYHQIRLYRPDKGRFSASSVHDTVRPEPGSTTKVLQSPIAHRSIRSMTFQVDKYNRYSNMQVADMRARGRSVPKLRLLAEFPVAFFKGYVMRQYWRYGWWGFVLSMNFAHSRFLRIAKAYEADLMDNSKTD